MKIWSTLILVIFLNFNFYPGIAQFFGQEIVLTNVVLTEEETHSNTIIVYEKTIPDALRLSDYITKFFIDFNLKGSFLSHTESIHLSPYISIFSPPPEMC